MQSLYFPGMLNNTVPPKTLHAQSIVVCRTPSYVGANNFSADVNESLYAQVVLQPTYGSWCWQAFLLINFGVGLGSKGRSCSCACETDVLVTHYSPGREKVTRLKRCFRWSPRLNERVGVRRSKSSAVTRLDLEVVHLTLAASGPAIIAFPTESRKSKAKLYSPHIVACARLLWTLRVLNLKHTDMCF